MTEHQLAAMLDVHKGGPTLVGTLAGPGAGGVMMDGATHRHPDHGRPVVLVVDDYPEIGLLVEEILTDEGYAIAILRRPDRTSVQHAVEELRPGCILLDGDWHGEGSSWAIAEAITAKRIPVPVIMFSADREATDEAHIRASQRSRLAGFASVLPKPFDIDELVKLVTGACRQAAARA
jgi:DNA-binding response OmpR family regulator